MIDDVVEGVFKVVGRFIGQIFYEIVFELLIKGPGYFISKQFTNRDLDPDGFVVVATGFAFWLSIGTCAYVIYQLFGGSHHA